MADLRTILADPDFRASSPETKREILSANDTDFAQSSRATQDEILGSLGRAQATPAKPAESVGGILWRNLKATPARMVEDLASDVRGVAEFVRDPPMATVLPFVVGPGVAAPAAAHMLGRMMDTPPTVEGVKTFAGEAYRGGGQFVGSTAGSLAGQRYGTPGAVTGAAVGGGVGRLVDVYRAYRRGDPLPQSVVADAFRAAGISGASELVGRGVLAAGSAVARSVAVTPRPDAARVLESFRATGVTPKVTDVTASRTPAVLERAVAQTVTGSPGISGAVARQAQQLSAAADDYFLARLGPQEAASGVATGQRVLQAVERSVERSKGVENRLFAEVTQKARDVTVDVRAIQGPAQELLDKEMQRLARHRDPTLIATLKEILAVGKPKTVDTGLLDATGAPIKSTVAQAAEVPFEKAQAWARGFGEVVSGERQALIAQRPVGEAKLMFRTVMDAIEASVQASGKTDLQAAFSAAREFATLRREIFVDSSIAQIMRTDPEKVVGLIGAAGGPSAIRRAKEAIFGVEGTVVPDPGSTETWNYVRRHIFEGIFAKTSVRGEAKGVFGQVISGAGLERELKRIGPESLNELLAPTERAALTNVLTVAKAIRTGEALASAAQSTTAQQLQVHGLFALPGLALSAATGGVGLGTGSALSMLLAPPALAKLLTSERAVQVLASPGFARLATDLRLGGRASAEATLALERLGAALMTGRPSGSPAQPEPPTPAR